MKISGVLNRSGQKTCNPDSHARNGCDLRHDTAAVQLCRGETGRCDQRNTIYHPEAGLTVVGAVLAVAVAVFLGVSFTMIAQRSGDKSESVHEGINVGAYAPGGCPSARNVAFTVGTPSDHWRTNVASLNKRLREADISADLDRNGTVTAGEFSKLKIEFVEELSVPPPSESGTIVVELVVPDSADLTPQGVAFVQVNADRSCWSVAVSSTTSTTPPTTTTT